MMNKNLKTATALSELARITEQLGSQFSNVLKNIQSDERIVEQILPEYVNPKFKSEYKLPTVYRFNQKDARYYCTVSDGEVTFYPSVTTVIGKTTPTSFGIKKLIGDLGMKGFYQMMREKAKYGTLLHVLIAEYLRSGDSRATRFFDLDSIGGKVALYAEEQNIDFDISDWEWNVKKDLLALIQFVWDNEVDPLAIEVVGTWDSGGGMRYAGAIDLLCEITVEEKGFFGETYKTGPRKGEPKESKEKRRVRAIVDFKSGKAGFFEDHEIQLHMYKRIAEQSFGIEIDKVFNVAPKEWRSTPSYSLKDQSESNAGAKIPHLLNLFNLEWEEPKEILSISGKINGSGMFDNTEEFCRNIPASQYVLNNISIKNN